MSLILCFTLVYKYIEEYSLALKVLFIDSILSDILNKLILTLNL